MALGGGAYVEALGSSLLVIIVLLGLGQVEGMVARAAAQTHLVVHARPDATAVEDLEAVVRRSGLDIQRTASRRENVDLVVEFDLRGPKRLHNQVLIGMLNHPGVRSVSTGE
jgi:uncharacterized membrane protein YhiD involved in acid resistance